MPDIFLLKWFMKEVLKRNSKKKPISDYQLVILLDLLLIGLGTIWNITMNIGPILVGSSVQESLICFFWTEVVIVVGLEFLIILVYIIGFFRKKFYSKNE